MKESQLQKKDSHKSDEYEAQEIQRRLIELEIENEDLKIYKASDQIEQVKL